MGKNNIEKAIFFRPNSRAAEQELNSCICGNAILDDGDQDIAAIFAARGLSFDTGRAEVVSLDEIRRQEAAEIYHKKARLNAARALLVPACAVAILYMGVSFGWITTGFFRFLVAGCITWAAAAIWG